MKLRRWTGLVLAMAGGVPGCSVDGEPGVETVTITQQSIDAQSLLVLDTRYEAVSVDQSAGAIDFGQIELICPDGTAMDMQQWLEHTSDQVEASLSMLDDFYLGRTIPPPPACEGAECDCQRCELCPDGLWICYNTCGQSWNSAEQQWRDEHQLDPRLGDPEPPPDDPGDPYNPGDPGDPPPDGSDGSGGSGGSGNPDGSGGSGGSSGGSGGSGGSSGGSGGGGYGGGGGGGTTNPGP